MKIWVRAPTILGMEPHMDYMELRRTRVMAALLLRRTRVMAALLQHATLLLRLHASRRRHKRPPPPLRRLMGLLPEPHPPRAEPTRSGIPAGAAASSRTVSPRARTGSARWGPLAAIRVRSRVRARGPRACSGWLGRAKRHAT